MIRFWHCLSTALHQPWGIVFLPAIFLGPVMALAAQEDDELHWSVACDQSALIAAMAAAPLSALWWDPSFAEQRAVISEQISLHLQSEKVAPLLDILQADDVSHTLHGRFGSGEDDGEMAPLVYVGRLGTALDACQAWLADEFDYLDPQSIAGIAGHANEGEKIFIGYDDNRLVLGHHDVVAHWSMGGRQSVDGDGALAVSHVHLRPLVRAAARIAELEKRVSKRFDLRSPYSPGVLEALFGPQWPQAAPVLRSRITSAAGQWQSTSTLSDLASEDLPTLPVDLAGRLIEEPQLLFASSFDLQQVLSLLPLIEDEMLALDLDIDELEDLNVGAIAAAFGQQVAVSATWQDSGPMPQFQAMVTVRDYTAVHGMLESLIDAQFVKAQPTTVAGSTRAWSIPFALAPLTIALNHQILVVSNRVDFASAALQPTERAAPWSDRAQFHLSVACKSLAEYWLPSALGQLASIDEPLGRSPLRIVRRIQSYIAQDAAEGIVASASSALLDRTGRRWLTPRLDEFFIGSGDLAERIDSRISIWQQDQDVAVVLRIGDHRYYFRRLDLWRGSSTQKTVDGLAAINSVLAGYTHSAGPALADVALTTLPAHARFDHRWLPSVAQVIGHLPDIYVLSGSRAPGGGLRLTEQGLPVLGVLAHWVPRAIYRIHEDLGGELREAEVWALQHEVLARHPDIVAVFTAMGDTLRFLRQNRRPVPNSASELIRVGRIELDALAPLFAGRVPTSAEVLDGIGVWNQNPRHRPRAVWALQLEPGWSIIMTHWGKVEASQDIEAPPLPVAAEP